MFSLSVEESQAYSRSTFALSDELENQKSKIWKILLYDQRSQAILSTMFKVQDLRELGVTLNLLVSSKRGPVPDAPAIYFLTPTEENIKYIVSDIKRKSYEEIYLHFTDKVSEEMLKQIAVEAVKSNYVNQIIRIYEHNTDFISLDKNVFTLDMSDSLSQFHKELENKEDEDQMKGLIEKTAQKLYCLLYTMKWIPSISCTKGHAAEMVGKELSSRISSAVQESVETELSTEVAEWEPVKVLILDRSFDYAVTLHHTCTYQALIHDLLEFKFNRVSIPHDEHSKKTFELDSRSDEFWRQNKEQAFPEVAAALTEFRDTWSMESKEISESKSLEQNIQRLPEIKKRKKMLDSHMDIATCLNNAIKGRNLAKIYQSEESMLFAAHKNISISEVEEFLLSEKSSVRDKQRYYILYYLTRLRHLQSKQSNRKMSDFQFGKLEKILEEQRIPLVSLDVLKNMMSKTKNLTFYEEEFEKPKKSSYDMKSLVSGFSTLGMKVMDKGAEMVKDLMISNTKLPITHLINAYVTNDTKTIQSYDFKEFHCKGGTSDGVTSSPGDVFDIEDTNEKKAQKVEKPITKYIVFFAGSGNYIETQNLFTFMENHNKQVGSTRNKDEYLIGADYTSKDKKRPISIFYGSSQMLNSEQFLDALEASWSRQ